MPSNKAAMLMATKVKPLQVKDTPYTSPDKDQIVVKNGAVAINPLDYFKQNMGDMMYSWTKYPLVLGADLAGEVVEVGEGVTRFKVGDRVLGLAVGLEKWSNKSSEGAFQNYTILRTKLAAHIPPTLSYTDASVLPLCVSTAACGLFQKDYLALEHPKTTPVPTGKTLLVWGGSTSVGSNAIQLAVAAGYEVIATASPKNFDYVKRLGASEAYDYRSKTVVKDIIKAFQGRVSAGAIAIGTGSLGACLDVVGAVKGSKFVAQTSYDLPEKVPSSALDMAGMMIGMTKFMVSSKVKGIRKGVSYKFIWGSALIDNEVGPAIWENFLPDALAQGKYAAAPEPQVIGHGLEYVQEACDTSMKGLSAKKAVVTL